MDRKIKIILLLLVMATSVFAQKRKVAEAIMAQEEGDLPKAYAAIMEALNPNDPVAVEKTLNWPRAWEVKASILFDIHKMGIRNVTYEPLLEAYNSYQKILELNPKKGMLYDTRENLRKMMPELSSSSIKAFKLKRYDVALQGYQKYLEIANMPLIKHEEPVVVDTTIFYNAGLAAFSSKAWDEALKYFSISKEKSKYGEDSFFYIYGAYQALGDTINQYNTLKQAFKKYPDSENLNIELVKFCIDTDRPDEAVNYIDVAIKKSPENAAFYSLKGRALEDAGDDASAIDAYKKAIELDSSLFVPTYNLAVIYYNKGVYFINNAIKLPQDEDDEYLKQVALGNKELIKGLPLFEKASEMRPENEKVKESLKFIKAQMGKFNSTN